jgi:antitoxin ChpS
VSRYVLRRAGGSVMVTIPPAFLKRMGLTAGSTVEVNATVDKLVITPAKAKVTLADILKAAPKDAHKLRVEGWDEMPAASKEA